MASDATAGGAGGEAPEEPTGLKRSVTKRMLLFFILGDILGGGIYALPGDVGDIVGGGIWAAFMLAFVLALFTAGAYAELSTKYPRAGGAASYVNRAYRQPLLTFLVAFAIMASGISSASALSIAFGQDYFSVFLALDFRLVAAGLLVLIAIINFIGISESVKLNVVFTCIEVLGLLIIIVVGLLALNAGVGEPSRVMEFKGGGGPLVILAGAGLSFYAMIGFEDSVNLAEEVQDPRRSFPPGLFGGMAAAAFMYLLVTLVAPMVVDVTALAEADNPLLQVVRVAPYSVPQTLFASIGLFALSNGALINMIMASRLLYGMSEESILPRPFGKVHPGRLTPWVSILFTSAIAFVLVVTGGVEILASTTVVLLLAAFILVNIAVLVLRKDRVEHHHFKVPTFVPVVGALTCAALLTQQSGDAYLRAVILMVIGVVLWVINRVFLERTPSPDAAPSA
ncbi:MAG: APC family permease [Actinomycetota bacterium]|nr:APC family permease [Actinomycetota bacterium]